MPGVKRDPVLLTVTPEEVLSILPHRGRALWIREPVVIRMDERMGTTALTITGEHCEGHFPDSPIFPGKEWVEMIAQTLGIVGSLLYEIRGIGFLASIGSTKYRGIARPGDHVSIEATIDRGSKSGVRGSGRILGSGNPPLILATVEDVVILRQRGT